MARTYTIKLLGPGGLIDIDAHMDQGPDDLTIGALISASDIGRAPARHGDTIKIEVEDAAS